MKKFKLLLGFIKFELSSLQHAFKAHPPLSASAEASQCNVVIRAHVLDFVKLNNEKWALSLTLISLIRLRDLAGRPSLPFTMDYHIMVSK